MTKNRKKTGGGPGTNGHRVQGAASTMRRMRRVGAGARRGDVVGAARIDAASTFDFGDGNGAVAARRHVNPDGTEGGWVAETAHVAETATVTSGATVRGCAQVRDYARVTDSARVSGDALVCDNAQISDNAQVSW